MSTSVTVSVRSLVVCSALVLVVVAAYVVGSARGDAVASEAEAAEVHRGVTAGVPGTVTMTGTGEAVGVPDEMRFRVSVTREAVDVAGAMDEASSTLSRVLGALEDEGVERRDVQSTGLSVDPVYRYDDDDPPIVVGYRVQQSVSVLVRDLRAGGAAVSAVVGSGGDAVRVSGIGLQIGDRDALLEEARDDALSTARAKAEQYAAATGQSLGPVLTLTEGGDAVRPARPQVAAQVRDLRAADVAALPVRAGREDVGVRVSVVWQLLPAEEGSAEGAR